MIPIVLGRGMVYSHISGEIYINGSDRWSLCTGNDSTEQGCMIANVSNTILSNVFDHLSPYEDISISTPFCGWPWFILL